MLNERSKHITDTFHLESVSSLCVLIFCYLFISSSTLISYPVYVFLSRGHFLKLSVLDDEMMDSCVVAVESTSGESEHSLLREQELVTFASGQNGRQLASNRLSFSESSASHGSCSNETGAPPAIDEITRDSAGSSSAETDALVVSNYTGSNGISMFQR